jgi:maltooligosyltrehalose trehalohydrolase
MKRNGTSFEIALPAGAHVTSQGVAYKVWAPDQKSMQVSVEGQPAPRVIPLRRDGQGYWSAIDPHGRAGDLYRFRLGDGALLPDVASRFQPQGVHGPSECIDATGFKWQCQTWRRPKWTGQSIYEIHLGTFTTEGTFRAAIEKLPHIAALGAEAVEIMPIADFPGERNWGYDGVCLYAPARCYGRPDDFRALVDAAHAHGLAVILDVVYNHLGPVGNQLPSYSPHYFHSSRATPWGQSYDLDGPNSGAVRSFLIDNATYWLDEFHLDGLRLDATHAIPDESDPHLLKEIVEAAHARGAFVIAEDERNSVELLHKPDGEGTGVDAVWSDDFHHQVRVALTGVRESYLAAYGGTTADVAATLEHGWSYRGQSFPFWQGKPRGAACAHLPANAFVFCIENHDQVGNRAKGERLEHLITADKFRAASVLLCLSPYTPMLLMGQEWAAGSPFLFFTDHAGEHGRLVSKGREKEFEQSGLNRGIIDIPDPQADTTFTKSKLNWGELNEPQHAAILAMNRLCFSERRTWLRGPALIRGRWKIVRCDDWIGIRYQFSEGDRMLLFALTQARPLSALPEAFQAPGGHAWHTVLHSNEATFGGEGPDSVVAEELAGPVAVWLVAVKEEPDATA